ALRSYICFSSRRRHTRSKRDWSSDVCSSDLTQRLVQEIVDFEYIVTTTEIDALVLEMNLIKKYDPKYNVLLKDDKSYPYLKITSERHPRLLITRRVKNDQAKYFGPYPD